MKNLATFTAEARDTGRCVLTAFLKFLWRPDIAASEPKISVSTPALLFWLLFFSFAATALIALLALPLIVASDAVVGQGLRQVLDHPAFFVLIALIVSGPLVEEMIFRGWLTGTIGALSGTAIFLAVFYGGSYFAKSYFGGLVAFSVQLFASSLALIAFILMERGAAWGPPRFYNTLFPYAFWIQGVIFGGLHFANFGGSSFALPIVMTAPLIIVGWIFAYARVVAGIGAAWLLHALYNVPAAVGAILLSISTLS